MFKLITTTTIALLLLSTNGQAQEQKPASAAPQVTEATRVATGEQQRRFPVIIRNEVISTGTCRLHFENGGSLEVGCTKTPDDAA